MRSPARVILVAVLLAVLGATFGALAGVLVGMTLAGLASPSRLLLEPGVLGIGAAFGAPLGAILFPIAGFALMRHVALGRALFGTVVGTVAGGTIGWIWPGGLDRVLNMLIGSVVGFFLAVVVLRRATVSLSRNAVAEPGGSPG